MIQLDPINLSSRLPVGSGHALQPGALVEAFEIVQVLGLTSFGVMYLAVNTETQGIVVIKEYLPAALAVRGNDGEIVLRDTAHEVAFARGRESFVAESLLLTQFEHPNLLRVSCVWEAQNTAYRAMPQYRGTSLLAKRFGMKAPMSEGDALSLLEGLLDAERLLNDAGLAHGQIEPMNILMLDDGRPMLLDFDAARHAVLSDSREPFADSYSDPARLQTNIRGDLRAIAGVMHFLVSGLWSQSVCGVRKVYEPLREALARFDRDAQVPAYSDRFLNAIDQALAAEGNDQPGSVAEFRALFEAQAVREASQEAAQVVRPMPESETPIKAAPVIAGRMAFPTLDAEPTLVAAVEIPLPASAPIQASEAVAAPQPIATPTVDPVIASVAQPSAPEPAERAVQPAAPQLVAQPPVKASRPAVRPMPEHAVRSDFPPHASASENVLALLANFGGGAAPTNAADKIEIFHTPVVPVLTEEAEPTFPPKRVSLFDAIDAAEAEAKRGPDASKAFGMPRPSLRRLALWAVAIALLMVVSAIAWQLKR